MIAKYGERTASAITSSSTATTTAARGPHVANDVPIRDFACDRNNVYGGKFYVTETQKRIGRVHEVPQPLLDGLFGQWDKRGGLSASSWRTAW